MEVWGSDEQNPPDVVVPDDASSLETDRRTWLAELRAARRRRRAHRMIFTRRWEQFGLSGPIVTLVLLAVSVVGVATVFFASWGTPHPPRKAMAPVPAMRVPTEPATPGDAVETQGPRLGHRLPPVRLASRRLVLTSSQIRPALLAVVPTDRDCGAALLELRHQSRSNGIALWMVGSGPYPQVGPQLERLDATLGAGTVRWGVDEGSVLRRALAADGLTLVLVGDDGVVQGIHRNVSTVPEDLPDLGPQLAVLVTPARA